MYLVDHSGCLCLDVHVLCITFFDVIEASFKHIYFCKSYFLFCFSVPMKKVQKSRYNLRPLHWKRIQLHAQYVQYFLYSQAMIRKHYCIVFCKDWELYCKLPQVVETGDRENCTTLLILWNQSLEISRYRVMKSWLLKQNHLFQDNI